VIVEIDNIISFLVLISNNQCIITEPQAGYPLKMVSEKQFVVLTHHRAQGVTIPPNNAMQLIVQVFQTLRPR
jgi:hypothetical protein